MSNETNPSARHRPWPRRRILGSVLGLAVVVGTGAVAEASSYGDGFLRPGAVIGANGTAPTQGYGTAHGTGVPSFTPYQNGGTQNGWTQNGGTQNSWGNNPWMPSEHAAGNMWTWTGKGANRWGFQPVVNPGDPTFNQALSINNRGVIVGYFGSGEDDAHPNKGWWARTPYGQQSFRDVNYPGSTQTQVIGINDDGTVVGFYVEADKSTNGFVRWQGHYSSVDFPQSSTSQPPVNQLLGISRNGLAAGFYNDAAGNAHGYLFNVRTHRFAPIQLPWGATSVTVTGVNDDGTVVGFAVVRKVTVAFLVNRHTAQVIKLGNGKNTQALGVNRWGAVVGSFEDGAGMTHGFVWSKGRVRTVDAPWHAKSTVVNGLNDAGWIVGFFEDSTGNTKGFLARS